MKNKHLAILPALALAACSQSSEPAATPGHQVAIHVAPLSLVGVGNVAYTITVRNGQTPAQVVWTKALESKDYGNGRGDLAYVGPCDASANPNTIELSMTRLEDADGGTIDPATWRNPTPVTQSVTCVENADVPVEFNLVVARSANQGFFDIAVTFEDIFCSAKLDCVDALLSEPDGDGRGKTVVVGLACTSGNGETTWLHQDDLVLACTDGTVVRTSPTGGPGNLGGDGAYVFQRATYRGKEKLPGLDKCYWNTALGIDDDAIPAGVDCTLTGRASASPAAWSQGFSPTGWTWPSISWDVKVVTDGVLACGSHALDVAGSGVATGYPSSPTQYAYSMRCEDSPTPVTNGFACSGTVPGFTSGVLFADTPDGVVVTVGTAASAPMPLPPGARLAGCCVDPCCAE